MTILRNAGTGSPNEDRKVQAIEGVNSLSRSLRGRLVAALALVLLPAALIALGWTVAQNRQLRQERIDAATQANAYVAAQIDEVLREAQLAAAELESQLAKTGAAADSCSAAAAPVLGSYPELTAVAVFTGDTLRCAYGFDRDALVARAGTTTRERLSTQLAQGLTAVLDSPVSGGPVLLASAITARSNRDTVAIFSVSHVIFEIALRSARVSQEHGSIVLSPSDRLVAEYRTENIPADWLPRGGISAQQFGSGSHAFMDESRGGDGYRYFATRSSRTGVTVLTGYPSAAFFSNEQRQLWGAIMPPVIMLLGATIGIVFAVDRLVLRWLHYLKRLTRVYGSGRFSVRAVRLVHAPSELAELGEAFDNMAENIAQHAEALETVAEEKSQLLRELHHRVKNNFQVIVSLLSLHKQALPAERRDDIRFIEDHVQAMAVAYRVCYALGDITDAPLTELLEDVVDGLRRSAALPAEQVRIEVAARDVTVDLDRAIGIGLYLAALLPAYLDEAQRAHRAVELTAVRRESGLVLSCRFADDEAVGSLNPLRERLTRAYVRQLAARPLDTTCASERSIELAMPAPGPAPA
ncbi:hypothetical protein IMF23_06715 [Chelatococcus daeguensis]|uniref:histidine kinase n=1 Tax=Chelatococcus sambhunathii TaxID=363953 RepID=A0ABM9U0W1_9HYPH|nr:MULTISPECIES: histidine kinase dimerization/phosphoacceptor domain -containing protein [Chelatococcus]KZE34560.1 hypothetical protein AVW15_17025 [Chelatococcus daeguensis]MBM3083122.1 hypothetical protein [Chelatococcus daeguensis]CUA85036.1 Two-component sensor histidine kinase, HisKA and HATPase domains [Chelatococcus sambhunathii]